MPNDTFAAITPGEMLMEEFLVGYGLSQTRLAKSVGISPNRIAEIVNNRRRITADTALRLGLYFGNSPEFWMNLQRPNRQHLSDSIRQQSADFVTGRGWAGNLGRALATKSIDDFLGKRFLRGMSHCLECDDGDAAENQSHIGDYRRS